MSVFKSKIFLLFINMERSASRREWMQNQLKRLNVEGHRIDAIDGAALPENIPEIDPKQYEYSHGRAVRCGEIGCYLSHIKALNTFLHSTYDYGLILEDDAKLPKNIHTILEDLIEAGDQGEWDFVKLQSRRKKIKGLTVSKLPKTGHRLKIPFMRSTGATAYMVNKKAAQQMVDKLLPIEAPYDHAFDRPALLDVRYRILTTFPIVVDNFDGRSSTIEVSKHKKFKDLRKLCSLWWRAKSEVSRFIWAISASLKVFIFK